MEMQAQKSLPRDVTTPISTINLAVALSPAWLTMAWLVSRAQRFWSSNPELQFGWVVLMLCAYLIWEAWEKRGPAQFRWSVAGVALGTVGILVLFVTQLYQAAYGLTAASMSGLGVGMVCVVLANLSYVFGWSRSGQFVFGFCFILIALPIPSVIYGAVVGWLQGKVAYLNVEVLNLLGIPAVQVGSLIHLPVGTVGIDEACSGIRSLQSTIMATLFIGYLSLKRRSFQVLLFLSGIGLAVFGNVVRSLYLSLRANSQGIESISHVHDAAGWSILAFTAVGVIILSWLMNKLEAVAAASGAVPPRAAAQPAGHSTLAVEQADSAVPAASQDNGSKDNEQRPPL
ncbi:MAG: exosortase/archaeosortase family protein [Verrucomicrobia bacterium]|nr:exosortase/archaeosortase family protein [Verrucomicrobiota bacterium]